MDAPLACSVRDCGLPLDLRDAVARCARGHAFDRSRHGYWNLLQPQDKKAEEAGDPKEAVQARRRVIDRGLYGPLRAAVAQTVAGAHAVVDLGCGEGAMLAAIDAPVRIGIDLAPMAIELAAKRHKGPLWVIANADRRLPVLDRSIDVVICIDGRKNGPEIARIGRGRAVVVVSGGDDLMELREAIYGEARPVERVEPTIESLRPAGLVCTGSREVRSEHDIDAETAADILKSIYRGQRTSERRDLAAMKVTQHHVILEFAIPR